MVICLFFGGLVDWLIVSGFWLMVVWVSGCIAAGWRFAGVCFDLVWIVVVRLISLVLMLWLS